MKQLLLSSLAVMLLCACATKIIVNGIEVYERNWNRTVAELTVRATFEMSCPEEGLQFLLLRRNMRQPVLVAVVGCGLRDLYQRGIGGWMPSMLQPDDVVPVSADVVVPVGVDVVPAVRSVP